MKTLIKTLLILYNVVGIISANTTTFNPLNYEGNESKYDVIVPKIISDDGNGTIEYDRPLQQARNYKSWNFSDYAFVDTNTGNSTTEKTMYKVFVQQCDNFTKYDTPTNFEFDNNGLPVITKALKSNLVTLYLDKNGNEVFRQKTSNESDLSNTLEFNIDGSPKFTMENNPSKEKQACTNWNSKPCFTDVNGNIYYYNSDNDEYIDKNDDIIASINIEDLNPILIQQTKKESNELDYNMRMPIIVRVLDQYGNKYFKNEKPVFRQIYTYEKKLNFDNNGNPIFLKDEHALIPFIKEDDDTYTEVNDFDYNIGELIEIESERDVNGKKVIKQKCITNNIQWYDFGTYYEWIKNGGYTTFPGQEHGFTTFTVKQDTNFIVKNNFELYEKSFGFNNYNVKLFIPNQITLTTKTNFACSTNTNFDILLCGTILQSDSIQHNFFNGSCCNITLILSPSGKIEIPNGQKSPFISNTDPGFMTIVIYPNFQLYDDIFNEGYKNITTSDYRIDTIGKCTKGVNTFSTYYSVFYLNRFINNDLKQKADLLSAILEYGIYVVYPNYMQNDEYYKVKFVENNSSGAFAYSEFFSKILWQGGHSHTTCGIKIPLDITDAYDEKSKHFFEDVYRAKKRLWDVDFVPDSFNRNVLNNTTVQNPFLEYDEKYYKGEIVDTITEGESPSYSGETSYNPSGDNNKYWRTDTVEDLFSNGESYNDTGILKNLPTTLNVGLINENKENSAEERVTTSKSYSDSITLNGDNQYFNGIYTIPSNFKQINLNNKTALLKIERVDKSGNVIYKDNNQDNSVDLSNLKYNVMTNIDWDLNKTGKGVVSETTATLDMDISSSSNNDSVITFTNPINTNINKIEFTGDNTGYNGYITLPDNITEVIFNNGNKQNDIDKAVLKILSITAKAYITGADTNNIIIKKFEEKFNMSNINKIIHSGTTYIKDASGIWKDTSENNMPDNLKNAIFETGISSSETFDKRDEINKLRSTTYGFNNKDYYFNTATVNSINQIDTCFKGTSYTYDDSNASNNMPPIINNGLINNGNITIINSDINNTKVELNGKNNGHKSGNNIGKPYTGNVTIPSNQNINTIQFGNYSFVPNIVNEQEDQYKTLMYFFEPNTINDVKKFDESTEPLSLTLKTMDIGHYASSNNTGKTVIDNTIIKAKTFKVRQGMNCTLQNGAHLTVKTNTNS